MINKDCKIIEYYKDMLIYEKDNKLYFGNKSFISAKSKNVRSAKNLITRYINKLSKKDRTSLKYLKYEMKEV